MADRLYEPVGGKRICYSCGNSYPAIVRFCPKDGVDLEYLPPPVDTLATDFRRPIGKWKAVFIVLVFAVIAAAFWPLNKMNFVPPEINAPEINASRGDLTVRTTPAGARVYLDGSQVGVAPVQLSDIPTGVHEVRVVFPGYLDGQAQVEILPSATRKLVWALTPLPQLKKSDRYRYLVELPAKDIPPASKESAEVS